MNDTKYIGLDVHQATISVAVLDSAGKLVMEAILETKAETILQFIHGLRGSLHVTLEEGTCAAWLHDVRMAFERNGIGWAMWDYDGNFGLATKSSAGIVFDSAILQALGMGK